MTVYCKYFNVFKNARDISRGMYFHKSSQNCTNILGIETSHDDTGCAIVDDTGSILGESLHSQSIVHLRYGGVNPIIAHDLHRDKIDEVVKRALHSSNLNPKDIDAIAVTTKPGLLVSLQVGVKYAKFLAKKLSKPLIPIHHMEAHALVARMNQNIRFPFLVLLISGGHCLLALVKDVDDFMLLGQGLDNAPGEVLDKAARRMKLRNIPAYSKISGGRAIELAAEKSKNPQLFKFPLPLVHNKDCNFSFSGLKDSLVRHLVKKELEHEVMGDGLIPEVNDLCAAFQLAVAEHLGHRTERAVFYCEKNNLIPETTKNIVVSGGVACNNFIFKSIEFIGNKMNYNVLRPPPELCTDNGVMIAWNGVEKFKKQLNIMNDISIKDIEPVAPLGTNVITDVTAANLSVKVTRLKKMFDTSSLFFFMIKRHLLVTDFNNLKFYNNSLINSV